MKFGLKKREPQLCHLVQNHFDILNHLGVAHKRDGQSGRTAISSSDS